MATMAMPIRMKAEETRTDSSVEPGVNSPKPMVPRLVKQKYDPSINVQFSNLKIKKL